MKSYLSFWIVPLLILITGCSTRVSTEHRHHNHESRYHNHVSVGVHGRTSGAGVLGALIVGGIIGSIIHDQQHQHEEQTEEPVEVEEGQGSSDADELANGYSIDTNESIDNGELSGSSNDSKEVIGENQFLQAKQEQSKSVEWYQIGKDSRCYLMGVTNGVTDVIAAVPDASCKQ